jgi:tellurite resistance protein TerA
MGIDYTKRPASTPQPAPPGGGGVSLSKVTLTKSAPSVSLSKSGAAGGVLRVNLNWDARPEQPAGGFFKRRAAAGVDLDLACLYEFTDGTKGVVQALGGAFTAGVPSSRRAVIWLDADDRSGTSTTGENLQVDLSQSEHLKRVLVFAFIYQGAPNWAAANAVVTLYPRSGPEVEIHLDEPDPTARTCAIAMLENVGGELVVRREVRYVQGTQSQLDAAYGWGMNWTAGRK